VAARTERQGALALSVAPETFGALARVAAGVESADPSGIAVVAVAVARGRAAHPVAVEVLRAGAAEVALADAGAGLTREAALLAGPVDAVAEVIGRGVAVVHAGRFVDERTVALGVAPRRAVAQALGIEDHDEGCALAVGCAGLTCEIAG